MKRNQNYQMAIVALLTAIMVIMGSTPLGTISFGAISITIAHIPILVATILLGLKEGLLLAFIFGSFSLLKSIFAPLGILDPLFQNPLISILPRLMIPITTYLVSKYFFTNKKYLNNITAIVVGNLTNTFFVYLSIYLFTKERFEALTQKNALAAIIGLVSTSTLIKTVVVVIITLPIVTRIKINKH